MVGNTDALLLKFVVDCSATTFRTQLHEADLIWVVLFGLLGSVILRFAIWANQRYYHPGFFLGHWASFIKLELAVGIEPTT